MMPVGMWVVVGWMLFVALTGVGFVIWGWKDGQFKNIEEAKYRMLEDREPEPWPDRKGRRIMTQNVLNVGPEALGIAAGVFVLLVFALAIALPHRPKVLPGSSGHRAEEDQEEHEVIRPDGYIDSFCQGDRRSRRWVNAHRVDRITGHPAVVAALPDPELVARLGGRKDGVHLPNHL